MRHTGLCSDPDDLGWVVPRRRRLWNQAERVVAVATRSRWAVVLPGNRPGARRLGPPSSPAPELDAKAVVYCRCMSFVGGGAYLSAMSLSDWIAAFALVPVGLLVADRLRTWWGRHGVDVWLANHAERLAAAQRLDAVGEADRARAERDQRIGTSRVAWWPTRSQTH